MSNLYSNTTIQNIREFLETQITSSVGLHYTGGGRDRALYNVKLIWGGDTYYLAYADSNEETPKKFLPITASNIQYFELV